MTSTIEEAISILQNDTLPENERKAAVHYIQYYPSADGKDALVEGLLDRDSGVRWACSTALAALGEEALLPLLRAIGSTSNDPMLREGALHALMHSSSKEVRDKTKELQEALEGPGAQFASMEAATKLMLQQ